MPTRYSSGATTGSDGFRLVACRLGAMVRPLMRHSPGRAGNSCGRNVLDRYRNVQVRQLYVDITNTINTSTLVTGTCRPVPSKLTTCWKVFLAESSGPSSCRGRTRMLHCWWCLVAGPRYTYTSACPGLLGHQQHIENWH